MKIVIASPHFPPRHIGGTEWEASRTASELRRRGHQVHVITVEHVRPSGDGPVSARDDEFGGVPVHRLSIPAARAGRDRAEYDSAAIGEHVDAWIEPLRPDVFHLFSGYLLTARCLDVARRHGAATMLTLMDYWWLCPRITMRRSSGEVSALPVDPLTCARCLAEERRRYRIPGHLLPGAAGWWWQRQRAAARPLEQRFDFHRTAFRQVDLVISRSHFLRDMMTAGLDPRPLIVRRPGVERLAAAASRPREGPLRLAYLGQIAPHKGVHVLVDAMRQLTGSPVQLIIHGDLDQFPAYARIIRRGAVADRRVTLEGAFRDRGNVTSVLTAVDAVVVPSLYYENCPNVILEAFAHGVPVIASALGGMREAVRDEVDGLLFEAGDPGALAARIKQILEVPSLLSNLRQRIQPPATLADEIDALEADYVSLVTRRTSARTAEA